MRRWPIPLLLLLAGLAVWALLPRSDGPAADGPVRNPSEKEPPATSTVLRGSGSRAALSPAKGWTVAGRVAELESEEGVSGALLRFVLVHGASRVLVAESRSAGDGAFEVPLPPLDEMSDAHLSRARLDVHAHADGYLQVPRRRLQRTHPSLRECFDTRRQVRPVWVERAPVMRGRVVDREGRGVDDVRVSTAYAKSATGTRYADTETRTDPTGEFHIRASRGWTPGVLFVNAWKVNVGGSVRLELPHDGNAPRTHLPDLVLEPGTWIQGCAVFPDGSPATGVHLGAVVLGSASPTARHLAGCTKAKTRTDGEGRFRFVGLRPGRVRINVISHEGRAVVFLEPEIAGSTGEVDVVLELPRPRLRVSVVDGTGAPVESARVSARYAWEDVTETLWMGRLAPGGIVSLWMPPDVRGAIAAYGPGLLPAETRFELSTGVWTRDITLVTRPRDPSRVGRLRVEAAYADGTKIDEVTCTLLAPLTGVAVKPPGPFRLKRGDSSDALPAGRWQLRVGRASKSERMLPTLHDVDVLQAGETVVEVVTVAPGAIRLSFPDREREPRLGRRRIRIRLVPEDPAVDTITDRVRRHPSQTHVLAPGAWTLYVEAEGYGPFMKRVVVERDQVLTVDVVLEPE